MFTTYLLLIADFTLSASSGETSLMPWTCAACAATSVKSSSSVSAFAVKGQSGTISAHAMYFPFSVSCADMVALHECGSLLRCRLTRKCDKRVRVTAPGGRASHWYGTACRRTVALPRQVAGRRGTDDNTARTRRHSWRPARTRARSGGHSHGSTALQASRPA